MARVFVENKTKTQQLEELATKVTTLRGALRLVVELCDDGDADQMTQKAARIAKAALRKTER